jgi:hypothetical protein
MRRKVWRWIRHRWRSIVYLWTVTATFLKGLISTLFMTHFVAASAAFVCGIFFVGSPEFTVIVALIVTLAMWLIVRKYRRQPRIDYHGRIQEDR